VADNLGTMMTAANAMNAASAFRSRSIVACAVCGVHQVHAPGDRIIRAHRRRQWSFECKGSGRRGIELGFADWFRNARSGALILVGGDPNTSEAIACRSCRRVFDVPRPAAGAFEGGAGVYVSCRHCNDCFPLASLTHGPQGVWVAPTRTRQDDGPRYVVDLA